MDAPSVTTQNEVAPLLAQAQELANGWQHDKAIEAVDRALALLDGTSDAAICQARLLRAGVNRLIGRWDAALEDYTWLNGQPEGRLRAELGVKVELGMAEILSRRGEYQKALAVLEAARNSKSGADIFHIACDVERAMLYARLGELDNAQSLLQEGLAKLEPYEAKGEHLDVVSVARCQQGLDQLKKGDAAAAARIFSTCTTMLEGGSYENERAECFRYLGICQTAEGFFAEALRSHQKALSIFRKTGFGQAKTYNSIGRSFLAINEAEEAIFYMEKGQVLCAHLKADAELATICGKLGEVYMQIQDFEKAIQYFQMDLELSDRFKNYYALGYTYRNLGRIHTQLDRTEQALRYLNESLALFQYVEDQLQIGRVYTDLAHLHYIRDEVAQAEEMVAKGQEIIANFPNAPERVWLTALQGMCLRHRGSPDEARRLLEQSLEQLATPDALSWRVDATAELGLAWLACGNKEQALTHLKAALKLAKESQFTKPARRILALIESIDEEELLRGWTRSSKTKTLTIESSRR